MQMALLAAGTPGWTREITECNLVPCGSRLRSSVRKLTAPRQVMNVNESQLPQEALLEMRSRNRLLVLTGAGMSAESGIATFRDALTGLWERFDAHQLASAEGFCADPPLVWGWYAWRHAQVAASQPNAGHKAVVALERLFPIVEVVTQNVDDLHERAGSTDVVHLHGRLDAARCFDCGHPHALQAPSNGGANVDADSGQRIAPPRCTSCGGMVRPGVVWFGESLPRGAFERAQAAAQQAQVVLVVGTSGLVYPAAGLPQLARENGALVIQVNPYPSELDRVCHHLLRGPAALVLPQLVKDLQSL
jgi:NAD-dependent deacetylase